MSNPRRVTFCLSSQHGCGFACRFCATGRMGAPKPFGGRDRGAGARLRRGAEGQRDSNVVMMGMGEPLENYDAGHGRA